jgi:DNA-binding MarR family transcriptional regulator
VERSDSPPPVDREALVERLLAVRPAVTRRLRTTKPPELAKTLATVTLHQLEALQRLSQSSLHMSELAKELAISESAATALVDRLVRQGLVRRSADPADRRVVCVSLSDHARALTARFEEHHRATVASMCSVLDDRQLMTLVELLELMTVPTSDPSHP